MPGERDLGAQIIEAAIAFERSKNTPDVPGPDEFDPRIIEALIEVSKVIQPVDGP
jgi:hypothetical protein